MATYKVMQDGMPGKDGNPTYQNTRNPEGADGPWLFCGHHHATYAEAEACRDFGYEEHPKRPADVNRLAKSIVDIATRED